MKGKPEDLKKTAEELKGKALQTAKAFASSLNLKNTIMEQAKHLTSKEFTEKAKNFAIMIGKETEAAFKGKPSPGSFPASPRAMRFPYTFTAKMVQFPWGYYVRNNWVYRYYFIAIVVCIPIVKSISNVFNSPTNVKKWEEIKRKEREAEMHNH